MIMAKKKQDEKALMVDQQAKLQEPQTTDPPQQQEPLDTLQEDLSDQLRSSIIEGIEQDASMDDARSANSTPLIEAVEESEKSFADSEGQGTKKDRQDNADKAIAASLSKGLSKVYENLDEEN